MPTPRRGEVAGGGGEARGRPSSLAAAREERKERAGERKGPRGGRVEGRAGTGPRRRPGAALCKAVNRFLALYAPHSQEQTKGGKEAVGRAEMRGFLSSALRARQRSASGFGERRAQKIHATGLRTGQEQNTWDGKAGTTTSGANFGGIGSERSGAQDPGSFAAAPGPPRDPVAGRPPRSRHCGVRCLHSRRLAARFRLFLSVSAGGSRGGSRAPSFPEVSPPRPSPLPAPPTLSGGSPQRSVVGSKSLLGGSEPLSRGASATRSGPTRPGGPKRGNFPGPLGVPRQTPACARGPPRTRAEVC